MKFIYSTQPVKIPDEQSCETTNGCNILKPVSVIMDKMWRFYSVILLSVIQMQHVLATGCDILALTSPSASTLNVGWGSYTGASVYLLDLRVVNSTTIAPVVVMQYPPSTQRLIQGLRPGHVYQVTLKVFEFYSVVCTDTEITMTVPATSQITFSKAISSTSIRFEWSSVIGADSYILFVEELFSFPTRKYNQTFTSLGGQVDGLTPSTPYNCYIFSSNVAGRGAKSNIRTITTLVQPPTGVNLVATGKSTAQVTWNSVNKVLLYQVTVSDNDNPSNAPVIRNTSTTSMDISDLEPCSTYTVGVSSVNVFLVPGEAANVTHTTSTINPVTTFSADYSCSGGMVTVNWELVFGANLYRATAVDGTGEARNCTSASTSCQITMLKCGETYNVRVTAISDDCESTSNISTMFETVPCAPASPHTIHDCSSNVIIFSWQPTNNTFYYVATAVDNTGKVTECRTPDNMCYFTNTGCGQFYKYNVYAVSSGCNSEVSQSEFVRTSPCLPTNIKTAAQCHSETLITTWDSAAGALSYTVEAQGNTEDIYNCTSSSNSCTVTGVPCGEHLSVWIVASNDNCSTDKVLGEVAQTVPCTPTNVSASVDCSPDSARFNWTTSIGAVFYIAVAQDSDGNSHSCNSMGTDCLMEGLRCGQNYTASVIGTNLKCNSSASKEVTFMTAPCPPTNIEAFRDCDANHALIVWQNHQPTGLYTATIEDQTGAQLNCTSNTVNNCKIPSLPCGKRYSVTATYYDGNCASSPATPISMDSVPCGPEDVHTSVACVTGELTIAWNISVPAENYTATISRGMGQTLHCNSTETECTIGGLACGSSYMVTVFSVTGTCFSLPSADVAVRTLPCPPTNVTAAHACAPDPVPVSWVASDSARYYNAVAVSSTGHTSECTTNETSCSLSGLLCGQVYTIGVAGGDDNCTGQQSDAVSLYTEPCAPSNVSSRLDCGAGAAHLTWTPSANAVGYAVRATSCEGTLTCNSTSTGCTLADLVCDHAYNISMTATDGTCFSSYSAPFRQEPVPCAPVNVNATLLCGTDDITVSWGNASASFNYSVTAMPLDGDVSSVGCHTDGDSCRLSGLHCGRTYNVSVNARSGGCSGPYSIPKTVHTAPCAPRNLTAVADCGANSVHVSWNASLGAASHIATITGPSSFYDTCWSSNLTCSFAGLQCATQYSISVASQDSRCSSSPSQTVLITGPCDPANVSSVLQCGSDTATVSWDAAAGAMAYTVLAHEKGSQHYTSCRSSTTSCQLDQLRCGKVYNLTVLADDATCNSTGGTGTILMTAPCSPSIQNSTLICGTNSSSLSWLPVADAVGYIVNATATCGHTAWCSSANASCVLTDLLCGETYTAAVTARGSQCDSPPGASTNITTTPCPPAIISKQHICSTNTAVFNWTDSVGHVGFLAQVSGNGYLASCRTRDTSCAIHDLPCGLDLSVTVQAEGAQCNSVPSVNEILKTVPCSPENITATLACLNHSALVSWVESPTAIKYKVIATSQNGHTHHCYTNATSCQVPDIRCGEAYDITVTPYSESCPGNQSAAHSFRAGLCPPSNVTSSASCGDTTVSWSNVTGAEMYIATATAVDGSTHTCSANYSSSCQFTDLYCGGTYAVTVVTVDRGCWSRPSPPVDVRTALCPPTNLTGQVSCNASSLTLMWDQSPVPGTYYTLQTEWIGGPLPPSVHTTPNTSHALTDLLCGQRYAFQIAAHDGTCRSSDSPPIEISTAPCKPTNFTAHVDCGTNKGTFSWAESSGAGFYTVEVTGGHGHTASCSSNDTSCTVILHCGHSYSATLVASTDGCNGTKHADIDFDSAPCLPEDVAAVLDCDTNAMNVSWTHTPGSDDYTAWAISTTDGHRASCNSTSNHCSISDLLCGHVYEVAVTSSSIHCRIIAGSDYKVQSAPCKPDNVTVEQNCSSSILTVTWSQMSTRHNYTVGATSASGVNSTCGSSEHSCSFLDLSCGQLYTFTVMGHTNVCVSEISTPVEKLTAPCPPTNVSAEMNCTTREALVSWSTVAAAATATAYSVQATSMDGLSSSCSDMGARCHLNNLACGQEYSVVVEAMNTGCPGPASPPVRLITDPCVPMNLSVHYNMSDAQVLWAAASGASFYSVQALTDQGATVTCNSSSTSCVLTGLQCSRIYNVTVMAHNLMCDSLVSETRQLETEPCPPTNVQANVACEQLTATVSWEQSDLAVGYVAYFDDQTGHYASCVAADTDAACVVSGLVCGTDYSVWVKALGRQRNSSASAVTSLTAGPCPPSSVEAMMDCQSRTATISWQPGVGAMSYVAEIVASWGHAAGCTANHTHCQLTSLQCGEEYNVTVKSVGDTCNSTSHMAGHLATEPCVPMNLSVHYNVSNAQVMWASARGAGSYSALAVTDQGLTVTCNTTSTDCTFAGLRCSQIYNVTVTAHNLACNNSATSDAYHLKTEPCPPANVEANMACEQLTVAVTWEQSDLAVGYVAYVDNQIGHCASCVGTDTDTSCVVSGLTCGTEYNVWVKALGWQYNSSASTVTSLTSAPCLPTDLEVEVDCDHDGAAIVSWNATHGTANFSLTASGSLQTLCETQQSGCNVTSLSCGETYNLSLTASNTQCSLTALMPANLTTRPCPPRRVAAGLQCGSQTVVLSWEETSDVELYVATAVMATGGGEQRCNSTGSSCQLRRLVCGATYNITVTAHSQACSSQASDTVSIQTEPCQPAIVSAQALCHSEEVQVSWHQASGVEHYLIRAAGSLGYVEIYNTTQTTLSAALPCGQSYNVTVQGRGSQCDSLPSSPAFFKTAPCVPRDITTFVQCESNLGSVSWGTSDGAETYEAVATGLDGHTHQCLTNGTSCTWDDLHCGEEYTVVVTAKGENCTSLPSNSSSIHMEPCSPQNLAASVSCEMKVVSLSWDGSNRTNLYLVSAESGNSSVGLSTNDTTAHLFDLMCGQIYSVTVTPRSQQCPGLPSAPASIQTWPCPPQGVSTMQDCLSSIVMVTWQASNGTDYYTATMQSDTGVSQMCMSDSNKCSVPSLTCGHNYSVSVTASNQHCNVTSSVTAGLQSVPCVPTNVSAVMDCANNTAVVSWSASRGATQYLVHAYSRHSSNVSCRTSDLSCCLDNLICGNLYTVHVVAMDDNCSSIPSEDLVFDSAPCPPQNVSTQVNCMSNDVVISWDAIREVEYFLVSMTGDNGGSVEACNTTTTDCSITNLTCGDTFNVHITSVRGDCRSQHAHNYSILSAPCQPRGIRGNLDCVTNSAWISWDAAPGADSYTVSAVGGADHAANCTTATNTTCEVEDLACGVLYNFSVVAKNDECHSQPSATIDLQTAPCNLSAITASPRCHNSSILVVWQLMEGTDGNTVYTATAEASDHTYLTCNNTGTSCSLHGARCDLRYTIIVAASSDQCSSMRSPPYRISMEPCPPRDMTVNASCEDHSALVSWTPSPVAETYHVVAEAEDGHVHTCNTTSNNCSMSELLCGRRYTVSVTASHENCSSKASQNATFNTGPCQPDGLSVAFRCHNQSATLSWTPRDDAVDYYGCAQAWNGDMLYCHSANPSCTIEGLDCGTVYNFSVQASDGTCNSSFSDAVQSGGAPCPPDTVQVRLLPMQMEVQVMFFSWSQVICRDTEYQLKLTGSLLGDSQAQFELSSYWTNMTFFEIPLPCGSSYVATVESRNAAGTSDPSVPLNGTTAPCPPSAVVYSGNSSFATVSWNASVFAATYTVYDGYVSPASQLCSTAGLSCTLSSIAATDLLITASNAAGESEGTNITNVVSQRRRRRDLSEQRTENGGLAAPILEAAPAMAQVIVVEWSSVDAASHYSLVMRRQGSANGPQELTVYGERVILTDLSPSSTYCFSVSARSEAEAGPESEPVCVQTGQEVTQ